MQQNWGRLLAVISIVLLLLPGVRSFAFRWIVRNQAIRRFGIQTLLAVPFFREKMLSRLFPSQ